MSNKHLRTLQLPRYALTLMHMFSTVYSIQSYEGNGYPAVESRPSRPSVEKCMDYHSMISILYLIMVAMHR